MRNIDKNTVPREVSCVTNTLRQAQFEAFLVGGCVRDLLIGKKPKDWDITTNAHPDEIISLFEDTVYENDFGTVAVVNRDVSDETLKIVEVTPYRIESTYSDRRRPDKVEFSSLVEDDLERRDFTINAMAYNEETDTLIDPYKGQKDLKDKIVKTVGNPVDRFQEDGLRILRALRFQSELGFVISTETAEAIYENTSLLTHIAHERIRDELTRIIKSNTPVEAFILAHQLGLLQYIIPELEEGIGVEQNQAHAFDVWTHNLKTLGHAVYKDKPFHVRLAALLHDVGKPRTRRYSKKKRQYTFYGHEVVGARMAEKILKRLTFSKDVIEKVVRLVRWHMFFSDTDQITLSAARRLVSKVGKENVWDLIDIRACDRIGTGRPKEYPYRLRKYKSMIEQVMEDPVSLNMLKIDGTTIIKKTGLTAGPRIGFILHALFDEVLDDPQKNTEKFLLTKAQELTHLSYEELKDKGEKGQRAKQSKNESSIKAIRNKHRVK